MWFHTAGSSILLEVHCHWSTSVLVYVLSLWFIPIISFPIQSRARPYELDENQPRPRPRVLSQFSRPSDTTQESRPHSQVAEDLYANLPSGVPAAPPIPPPRPTTASSDPEDSYSERVVSFLRQSDVIEQLQNRSGQPLSYGIM